MITVKCFEGSAIYPLALQADYASQEFEGVKLASEFVKTWGVLMPGEFSDPGLVSILGGVWLVACKRHKRWSTVKLTLVKRCFCWELV